MSNPYSYDLRAKVIQAIDGGMRKTEASRVFKLSWNTIDLWLKRRGETGDYKAKESYQKRYQPKIADLEKFKEFASKNASIFKQKWQKPGAVRLAAAQLVKD